MSRNAKGIIGYAILSVVFGIIVWPLMIGREYWQWRKYNLPQFEFDDVMRYSIVIGFGSVANWYILANVLPH